MHFVESLNIHASQSTYGPHPQLEFNSMGLQTQLIETSSGLSASLSEVASGHRAQRAYVASLSDHYCTGLSMWF